MLFPGRTPCILVHKKIIVSPYLRQAAQVLAANERKMFFLFFTIFENLVLLLQHKCDKKSYQQLFSERLNLLFR